ncbi:hypothetical protein BDM02DRAFT_934512 [Thelephora ganbajun]|uniref:Uncharacterized protein n=1 Tax=Thelephora ganbajun TaxID=370292 RepID=A0ACB6Z4I3_THEGA|nr:hypothetical protein BDM02DRAFT_934512 [Thelephora ganbajun]
MPSNGWVTKYACYVCKKNHSTNEQAMLVCASCTTAWHSSCHIPPVTRHELAKMWKAETDKSTLPHIRRLSTWRCMRCSLPFAVQSKGNIVDISSDSDEFEEDQPRRKRVARSKDPTLAAPPAPVDVIDLTEEVRDSQTREASIPDNSGPIRRKPRRIIIVDDDDDSTPRESGYSLVVNPQIHSPVETRLLPQILREEMEEPVTSAPIAAKKRPLHSKPQARRFRPSSRKESISGHWTTP